MDSKLAGKIVANLLTKSHHTLKHTSAILLCLLPSTSLYNFSVLIIYSKFPAYLQDISATYFAAFSIHLLSSQNPCFKIWHWWKLWRKQLLFRLEMSAAKNSNDFSGAISIISIFIPGNSTSAFGDFIEQRKTELMSQQKWSTSKTGCHWKI